MFAIKKNKITKKINLSFPWFSVFSVTLEKVINPKFIKTIIQIFF